MGVSIPVELAVMFNTLFFVSGLGVALGLAALFVAVRNKNDE